MGSQSAFQKEQEERAELCFALKERMRKANLTNKDIAAHLNVSESTVKRMFRTGDFTLQRLSEICQLLGIGFKEFLSDYAQSDEIVSYSLSEEVEKKLAKNKGTLGFLLELTKGKTPSQIAQENNLSLRDLHRHLSRLEDLKQIIRLPGDKVRMVNRGWWIFREQGPLFQLFAPLREKKILEAFKKRELQPAAKEPERLKYLKRAITFHLKTSEQEMLIAEMQELLDRWLSRAPGPGERKAFTLLLFADAFDQYEDAQFPILDEAP